MIRQSLDLRLQQKLSPQQIKLMRLIELPAMALEQRIKEEIEDNPALDIDENEEDEEDTNSENEESIGDSDDNDEPKEENEIDDEIDISDYIEDDDTPLYKLYNNNSGSDEERKEIPFSSETSFQEYLLTQFGQLNIDEDQSKLGVYIIGNIDETGYLTRDVYSMANDLAFSMGISTSVEELETVLSLIQDLDPPGIGARNLQECLLLQLKRLGDESEAIENAIKVIKTCFDEFTKKHYDKICKILLITEAQLKDAIKIILHLNPKPGNSFDSASKTTAHYIIPDFVLTSNNGKLDIILNSKSAPDLRINKSFNNILDDYINKHGNHSEKDKELVMFVQQKIDSARWFIDMIKQRQNTLYSTMKAIIDFQPEYFLTGDETKLKPMILKDIAEIVKMDVSTISRVANSKYIQTSFGTLPLKYFFSESMANESGEEISSKVIKKIIRDFVDEEDKRKPLNDGDLTNLLLQKGYNMARRTVAKYREQINIPAARMRKEL